MKLIKNIKQLIDDTIRPTPQRTVVTIPSVKLLDEIASQETSQTKTAKLDLEKIDDNPGVDENILI